MSGDAGAGGEGGAGGDGHRLLNPEGMPPAVGFSHVVVPAAGRTVHLAGQTAHGPDGEVRGEDFVGQFRHACENVRRALEAAGGAPEHLVSIQIFTTDMDGYLGALGEVGEAYRSVLGRHFPAMSMFEVSRLVDADAVVELVAVAVVPEA